MSALEFAKKTPPAGLVVDYNMPEMTGVDLVRSLRAIGIESATLMVTAFPDLDDVVYSNQVELLYRICLLYTSPSPRD